MIGIQNKDSTFFQIESPDVNLDTQSFSNYLISLTIQEQMDALTQGSLQFYDPEHRLSRILRTGVELRIAWGYKTNERTPESLLASKLNFDEVTGSLERRGYKGFVSSPSGAGSSNGVVTYNCNFTSFGFRGEEESTIYSSGTKKTVIEQAMAKIGLVPPFTVVDFTLGSDVVTADRYIRQDESTFAFIQRMSIEWGAFFYVTYNPAGVPVGIFIDRNKIGSIPWQALSLGATGGSNIIGYKGALKNVISYKWTSSESESGIGDNVQLDIVDGQIQFRRYVAAEETVVTYRLDPNKIQEVYQDASVGGLPEQVKLTSDLLSKNDFEQIKHFFIKISTTTAPNGYGYRIDAEMIGNPLYIPGNIIKVADGFPDRLVADQSIWYLHGVTHNISRAGYMMNIEVVDQFNLSPVGLVVR